MKRAYHFVSEDISKAHFKELLDIGAGTGEVPIMLAKSGKFDVIYGVDPSAHMLRIARSNSKELKCVRFKRGSSRHLGVDRKFDLIFSTISFHHWVGKPQALRYLSGFLKRNGEIRIYEFERNGSFVARYLMPSHSATKEELAEFGNGAGLKVKRIVRKDGFIMVAFTK
ncbi:MAG: class I SAM-dependent methyltransferase [Candidatus Micrarchaeaceae archaeon]